MADKLKSAVELAMERLAKAEGGAARSLTDEQKQQIADVRNRTAAKLAELEILHKSELAKLAGLPPEEAMAMRQKLDLGYREDVGRLERDRDSKIDRLRNQAS